MFKAGRIQTVVGEAEKKSAGGKHAAEVDRKLQDFRDNFDRMKYDEYILNGWFIGSVTQDPYMIGFYSVELAVKAAQGEPVADIDTGAQWYDASNIDDEMIALLVYD